MPWQIYLSGEIHTDWRERIVDGADAAGLDVAFTGPVTDTPPATTAARPSSARRARSSGTTMWARASTRSAPAR
jgi:hypothetical protein